MRAPTPRRGHHRAVNHARRAKRFKSARQFDILHQRHLGKPARCYKCIARNIHRLVAGGDAAQARAPTNHSLDDSKHPSRIIQPHIKPPMLPPVANRRIDAPHRRRRQLRIAMPKKPTPPRAPAPPAAFICTARPRRAHRTTRKKPITTKPPLNLINPPPRFPLITRIRPTPPPPPHAHAATASPHRARLGVRCRGG